MIGQRSKAARALPRAAGMLEPCTMDYFVHPSAIVDEPARIGHGTRIWHFCHLMAGAVLGRDCILGQNVFVAAGVRIGDGCQDPEQRQPL